MLLLLPLLEGLATGGLVHHVSCLVATCKRICICLLYCGVSPDRQGTTGRISGFGQRRRSVCVTGTNYLH